MMEVSGITANSSPKKSADRGTIPKPKMSKAVHIIDELMNTEEEYVKDMANIVSGYLRPLSERLKESDVKLMFSNIEEICGFHRTFLQKLKAARPLTVGKIGTIFTDIGEKGFMVYEEYYVKHPKASEFLQMKQEDDVFSSTLMGCQLFLDHKLPLNYYLLKPVQRLLKYPLLIQEMLKATEPSSMDYKAIERASTLMTKVATNINEIKRNGDITKYVTGLQQRLVGWDGPDLTTFGKLKDAGDFKVADSSNKRSSRQVLLFEYGILICKLRPGSLVSIKHHFQMSDLFLQTMLNDPILFRLTLANNKKVFFTFHCKSQEDKQYWIAKIKKVMIDFYRNLTAREKEAKEGGAAAAAASGASASASGGAGAETASASGGASHENGPVANIRTSLTGVGGGGGGGSGGGSSGNSSPKMQRKGMQRGTTRKRFNNSSAGAFTNTLPPLRKEAETDEKLTHNPFAQAGGFNGDVPSIKQIGVDHEASGNSGSSSSGGGGSSSAAGKFARAASKKFIGRRHKHRSSSAAVAAAAQRLRVVSSLIDDGTASISSADTRNSSYRGSVASSVTAEELGEHVAAAVANQEQSLIVKCNFPGNTQTSCIVRSSTGATIQDTFGARLKRRDFSTDDCHVVGPRGETLAWDADAFLVLKTLAKLTPDPVVVTVLLNRPMPAQTAKPSALRYSQLSEAEQERLDLEASQTLHSMDFEVDESGLADAAGVPSHAPLSVSIVTKFQFDLVDLAHGGAASGGGGGGEANVAEAGRHAATASFLEATANGERAKASKPKKTPGSPSLFRRVAASIKGKVGSPSLRRKRGSLGPSRRKKGAEPEAGTTSPLRLSMVGSCVSSTAGAHSSAATTSCRSSLQRSSFPPAMNAMHDADAGAGAAVLDVTSRSAFDATSAPTFPIRVEEQLRPRSASVGTQPPASGNMTATKEMETFPEETVDNSLPLYDRATSSVPFYDRAANQNSMTTRRSAPPPPPLTNRNSVPARRAAPPPPLPPRNGSTESLSKKRKEKEYSVHNSPRPPPPPPPPDAEEQEQEEEHEEEEEQQEKGGHEDANAEPNPKVPRGFTRGGKAKHQLSVKKPAPFYPGGSKHASSFLKKPAPAYSTVSVNGSIKRKPAASASARSASGSGSGSGSASASASASGFGSASASSPAHSSTAPLTYRKKTTAIGLRRSLRTKKQYDINGRPISATSQTMKQTAAVIAIIDSSGDQPTEKENRVDATAKVVLTADDTYGTATTVSSSRSRRASSRRTSQKRAAQSEDLREEESALMNRAAASSKVARHATSGSTTKPSKLNFRKRSEPRRHTEV